MAEKKKRIYTKRRQQVRRQLFFAGLILVLVAGIIVFYNIKNSRIEKEKKEAAKAAVSEDVKEEKETPKERLKRVKKEAVENGYPQGVIELLSKNAATVDYVENYGKKKDLPPSDTLGESMVPGEIPQILQWDERWGYAPYGTSNVAVSGCGPTCMSMVIAGLTGDAAITPAKLAAYGTENGYLDEENNTYWEFMRKAGLNWGIQCRESAMDEAQITAQLEAGHPVIISVGPGDFTKYGHFIVLVDSVDGKIKVNDPFSQENSDKLWDFERLQGQTKAAWVYSYGE